MKLLLQKNIWQEYAYDRFLKSLSDNEIDFQEVNVIPFANDFDQEVNFIPHAIFGSGRFVNVCRAKGFPAFASFEPVENFYPWSMWINGTETLYGAITRFRDLKDRLIAEDKPMFVKPYTEKFFTGLVIESPNDIDKIQLASSFIYDEGDELVHLTPVVNISEEVRFFIVNDYIVSASVYKVKGIPKHYRIDENHPAWDTCARILRLWGSIDKAFVIDLGRIDSGEWKIVELNNINSSGLYEIDTNAFARAIKHL